MSSRAEVSRARALAAGPPAALAGPGREEAQPAIGGPSLSVVVCTCANAQLTLRCVRALLACEYPSLEVIVVDNRPARSPVAAALAAELGSDERVCHCTEPRRGLAHARNAGLALARGDLVAFVDDDIVVEPAWASAVAAAFQPDVGCVTGLLLPLALDTPAQELFERFAGFGKGPERRRFEVTTTAADPLFPYAAGMFGSGANTVIRRSVALKLGGFDVNLGAGTAAAGGEDLDMYVRLMLAGESIVYEPAAIAHHQHPADARGLRRRVFSYGVGLTAMLTKQLLSGPRMPILRGAPAGVRYMLNPRSRKNAARGEGYPRGLAALELLGMVAGPAAYLRSVLAARAHREPAERTTASAHDAPTAMGMLDLERGLADIELGSSGEGPYASMRALVRLHGDPLTVIDVPASDGRVTAAAQAWAVRTQARPKLEAHAARNGCLRLDALDTAGLQPRAEPCPGEALVAGELPFVSVIVPTAGRPERAARCIEGLRCLHYPRFEILVVDNAPADGRTRAAVEALAAGESRCRYVAEPRPGSSVARNRGINEAGGELLAFTDDDVRVDPMWLTRMIEPFLEDSRVGVVTGLVMPARLDTPSQRWFEDLSGFGKGFERRVFDRDEHRADDRLLYPYWGGVFGSGNSMAFRPSVLRSIGGFDPALGAGSRALAGADIEAFSHAIIGGHRLVYEPRAICWHDHRADAAAVERQIFSYGVGLTAILTKWLMRDPRLAREIVRALWPAVTAPLHRGGDSPGVPHELRRLGSQLRLNRSKDTLGLQVRGYLVGPALYARSVLWARRLRLHRVLAGEPPQ